MFLEGSTDKISPVLLKIYNFAGGKFLQGKVLKFLFCRKSVGYILHQSEGQRKSGTRFVPSSRSEGTDFTAAMPVYNSSLSFLLSY